MMKKIHLIVLVVFGIFLMPTVSFACGSHFEKYSCSKSSSTNTEKMDCCKNDNHSKNKKHDGCNGKCGFTSCITTSLQFNLIHFNIEFRNNNFVFSEKQQNYFNSNINISSGFHSLWLIPK